MEREERELFLKKLKMTVAVVTVTVLIILLLIYTVKVFLLIFAAAMMAVFFRGIANWLTGITKLPVKATLPISIVFVLALWAGLIFALEPKVSSQIKELKESVPKAAQKVESRLQKSEAGRFFLQQLPFGSGNEGSAQSSETDKVSANKDVQKTIRSFFSSTLGVLGDFYVILLLGAFFVASPAPYKKGFLKLIPKAKRERTAEVIDATGITLRLWLFAKLLSMLVVALLTLIGLWILGVPLFITLALLAGLLSFIPNFGPLMAIIPAFLVAYVQDPMLGLWVVGLYVAVQTIESNFITPVIMKSQINIPLAMTLFSQLLLALLVGGLGLVFATPIIAMFMVIIQMVYVEDILGDRDIEVKAERMVKEKE